MLYRPLLVLREVGVDGDLLFHFWYEMEEMWHSKAKYHTPILLVRSAILVFRGGMLLCRRGILGLPGYSLTVLHMDVKELSRTILDFYFYVI